jgi:hypothetical protein
VKEKIGTCSQCGGPVMAYTGPWMGVVPPPPPECRDCGAVSVKNDPIVETRPKGKPLARRRDGWGLPH